ncbi:MAG: hypothetical protein ACLSWP_00935 [Terrisporobacter sp.]|uniref:hypothetical protein n=1 Tax=Terrisporobacter sp. TaxID=1965305 RepID=UPI003995D75A
MIIFAIPFRARETTKNWEGCIKRLNNTIKSIFNQTDDEFKVIVACNDIPKLEKDYDNRLEFIKTDIAIPHSWIEMARDKFYKLTVIAVRIREILLEQDNPNNGIYVMPVDADDLLNCNIAKYVKEHPNENGFVSKDGYVYYKGKKYFRIYKELHTFCGSCNIIKMYLDDLPKNSPNPKLCHDKDTAGKLNSKYPIRYNHNEVVEIYKNRNRSFARLPFRSTVYLRDTGDNISQITDKKEKDRFHPIAFLRSLNVFTMKFISKKLKSEFGIG